MSTSPALPNDAALTMPHYGLVWPGREDAVREAHDPALRRFAAERSGGAGGGGHRFYEADNLDALRALRAEIGPAVKVIYIDPPYNTGGNLLYRDKFAESLPRYRRRTGDPGAAADGRLHAQWLSMMYPRLLVARDLLREDGVMVVSIDDHEVHNLRLLLNEIFGERHFVSATIWRKKVVRGRGAAHVLPQTEYLLFYARDIDQLPPFSEPLDDRMRSEYRWADELGPYKRIPLAKSGTRHSPRPNLVYPIEAPDGTAIECPTHQWRWCRETLDARRDEIEFCRNRRGEWVIFTKQRLEREGVERRRTPTSYYDRVTTTDGTAELKRLFGDTVIDFPKPSALIRDVLMWTTAPGAQDDIVLDFFAGSAPTAQAVLELNRIDQGRRRCYLVQSPVPVRERSVAAGLGLRTIADIGRERIRRVLDDANDTETTFELWRPEPSDPGDLSLR